MIKRCIVIFPEFDNGIIIDNIRNKYDPLAKNIRPHITLVFPFESEIHANELKGHLEKVLCAVDSFKVKIKSITPVVDFGNYLFLNIETGKEEIIEIHKRIYSGLLEKYFPNWLKNKEYNPHMTVGKLETEEELLTAVEEVKEIDDTFETVVKKVSIEIIDENEDSVLEMELQLK